jgi:hypothetical protein
MKLHKTLDLKELVSTFAKLEAQKIKIYIQYILFSFIMCTKSEIINAEFLFILMHSIYFQKLIGRRARLKVHLQHQIPLATTSVVLT